MNWYNGLRDATNAFVDKVLITTRNVYCRQPDPTPPTPLPEEDYQQSCNDYAKRPRPSSRNSDISSEDSDDDENSSVGESQPRRKRQRVTGDTGTAENPFAEPSDRHRPSEYLRARCPLCFGGKSPPSVSSGQPHSLVSVDACFQQKHNKRAMDPPHRHPRSLFLDETLVDRMEKYVNSVRPPKESKVRKPSEEDDGYEHDSLRVPRSVLDGCNDSFLAADESREKASTQLFDVTGLMSLICRHDRVLWVVNVKSAGEKQHYVLVLIEMLFQHVPRCWTFGLLYDIACQIHRSCLKWGFLDRYLTRIIFAISVFHAYGHGWACQLIYHPRKCPGCGLTDGEGCERCWKSLRFLIAYLRVCGVSAPFII